MEAKKHEPKRGFHKLASMMGEQPEYAVLRRFGALNVQNLLYYQAELAELEVKLNNAVEADYASGDPDRVLYDRFWKALMASETDANGNPEQLNTVRAIRRTLKEYNEAVLLQKLIMESETPSSRDFKFLQTWMQQPTMGRIVIIGADGDIINKPDHADLIVLRHRRNLSPISQPIGDFFAKWYNRLIRSNFPGQSHTERFPNTVHYSQRTLLYISTLIGTICASVLPVVATVVLYYLRSVVSRLVMIAVFTAIFAGALGVLTNGRAIEIFSATAAFAAVQVVFVGTTNTS